VLLLLFFASIFVVVVASIVVQPLCYLFCMHWLLFIISNDKNADLKEKESMKIFGTTQIVLCMRDIVAEKDFSIV